jgi:hypothetical protein
MINKDCPLSSTNLRSTKMEKLNQNAKLAEVIEKVNEIIEHLNSIPTRDRGPKSERTMTIEDAQRILLGDLKDKSHKECAEILNLSYGQIYSARKGFTFKTVYKEFESQNK